MFVSSSEQPVSFTSCRLILPCISVGNVGQLTVDLLINTLKLPRVGYLHDPSLLPLVGNNAFDHHTQSGYLHTSAEVYHSSDLKVAVVQIRAPIAKGDLGDRSCDQLARPYLSWYRKLGEESEIPQLPAMQKGMHRSFCSRLLEWVSESGFSETVLLTSSHAHERRDSQIRGSPFRFLLTPKCCDLFPHFTQELHWTCLEPRTQQGEVLSDRVSPSSTEGMLTETQLFLPGAGLAKRIYLESSAAGLRLVTLVAFCSQGDNTEDAKVLATHLNQWTEFCKKAWHCPESWSLMYGGPSPEHLF